MAEPWLTRDFTPSVQDILQRADEYHDRYYAVETFGGPSLHFHRRALGLGGVVSEAERVELIYAVLVSWGMHRMGDNGSKMLPFEDFRSSLAEVSRLVSDLASVEPDSLDSGGWAALERMFKGISVMASGTTLVGNSKVMAHLLPKVVAPIDRAYTLNFLFGNMMFQNGLDREWRIFRKIHSEFYYPVAADRGFKSLASGWVSNPQAFIWDTSKLKVIDNLVIGAMKARG